VPAGTRHADRISEPPVHINANVLDTEALGWSEAQAWEELVAFTLPRLRAGVNQRNALEATGKQLPCRLSKPRSLM